MTDMQQTIELICEKVVRQMKEQGGSIDTDNHLAILFDNNTDNQKRVGRMLISHNLASVTNPNRLHLYTLTQKGWEFESFKIYREEKQFQKDFIKANFDTQKSIQCLNSKTTTFYDNQTNYNAIQKWLTFVIFLSAAVSAVVATCNYLSPKNSYIQIQQDTASHNQQLQKLENILKSHIEKDSLFEKRVKDSLGISQ